MILEMLCYTCAKCGHTFDAPALSQNAYGEFLLWSRSGEIRYLNALEDVTFEAVRNLLARSGKLGEVQSLEGAKVLQKLYGDLACDRDDLGFAFEIDSLPPCQKCGSQQMSSWTPKNPPEVVDKNIAPVSHTHWTSLADSEKITLVSAKLAEA